MEDNALLESCELFIALSIVFINFFQAEAIKLFIFVTKSYFFNCIYDILILCSFIDIIWFGPDSATMKNKIMTT